MDVSAPFFRFQLCTASATFRGGEGREGQRRTPRGQQDGELQFHTDSDHVRFEACSTGIKGSDVAAVV